MAGLTAVRVTETGISVRYRHRLPMRPGPSPLVGYNTNVRHKGKLYHIQTEDSGINHPHVITHLFADGGRIIASRKIGYAEQLGAKDLQGIVRKLMQEQHKAIFIELRDCVYDEDGAPHAAGTSPAAVAGAASAQAGDAQGAPADLLDTDPPPPALAPGTGAPLEEFDVAALERAAEERMAESAAMRSRADGPRRGAGRYQQTVPARSNTAPAPRPKTASSIFGGEVLRGKSLDEVILSYLSDDTGEHETER
jgi:hypothetical protein